MTDWESKWQEYCKVLDGLARERPIRDYLYKMEKRLKAIKFLAASGNNAVREHTYYASVEYDQLCTQQREAEEKVCALESKRDQLKAWFDLVRTEEATKREEMRLG